MVSSPFVVSSLCLGMGDEEPGVSAPAVPCLHASRTDETPWSYCGRRAVTAGLVVDDGYATRTFRCIEDQGELEVRRRLGAGDVAEWLDASREELAYALRAVLRLPLDEDDPQTREVTRCARDTLAAYGAGVLE